MSCSLSKCDIAVISKKRGFANVHALIEALGSHRKREIGALASVLLRCWATCCAVVFAPWEIFVFCDCKRYVNFSILGQ
jgi:hypothetical protein